MVNGFGGWGEQNGALGAPLYAMKAQSVFRGSWCMLRQENIKNFIKKIANLGYSETFFSIDYSLAIHEIQCWNIKWVFCTFTIFWLRGHQLDIGGGTTTPPAPPPLRSPLFEELWSDILPSVKNIGWRITRCPPELMPLFQGLGPQKKKNSWHRGRFRWEGQVPFCLKNNVHLYLVFDLLRSVHHI